MVNGIRANGPNGLNKGCNLKFCIGSKVRQEHLKKAVEHIGQNIVNITIKIIEHQWIALTFKPIVTWLAPWKASQLKLTSFIKECMSSMCTACGLAHFTRMNLSNSFSWVVSIHLFILNRITEGGLFLDTLLS